MASLGLEKRLLSSLRPRLPEVLDTLRKLTLLESPSLEKPLLDRCCDFLADLWLGRGSLVHVLKQSVRGNHLRAVWPSSPSRRRGQLLILGHYDTVYPAGTLQHMPFRRAGPKVFGPGTFDMKAGIVQALFALEALQQLRIPARKNLVFLWTSDEETGSAASRRLIETEARQSDAVLVLEPALGPQGLLKTSRKGVGEVHLIVRGHASHAGLAPERGVNAIHELARQIARIEGWNDHRRGVSVHANLIQGGTRTNVTADYAEARVDLRAWKQADMRSLERRMHALKPIHKGARLELRGGFNRPPLERRHSSALFACAQRIAKQLGFRLGEAAAGGGSDGNFTAALGIPTLDGLGAVGDGAHSPDEYVLVQAMPQRAALLAALLATC